MFRGNVCSSKVRAVQCKRKIQREIKNAKTHKNVFKRTKSKKTIAANVNRKKKEPVVA